MEGKTIAFFVIGFILVNLIAEFPFLIVLIIIAFFKFDLNINKILKSFWVTDYVKKNFWGNYEQIIAEMKKNQKHQSRIAKNREKRTQVERHYSTARKNNQISHREERLEQMQRDIENKKNEERSFYHKNQKTLQEKFAESAKQKKVQTEKPKSSWRDAVSSQSKNNSKNYFWNTKKLNTFGSWKSIWDNYESVTEKFSSNKK